MSIELRLNPAIDPAPYAEHYAAFGYVQIHNFLEPAAADALEKIVAALPWRLLVQNDREENVMYTREQVAAMTREEMARLDQGVRERAARNIGYTYLTYPMIEARLKNWDPGHPIHDFTDFLNSPEMIEFARKLIRVPGLTKTDAHATQFGPRNYLTRHIDEGSDGERRAAYTIGLSRGWEPDWGGLLLFHDPKLDVSKGLLPRFNTLTVFDGRVLHSVSCVSSFAPRPRVSIAGWFRDDAPVGAR